MTSLDVRLTSGPMVWAPGIIRWAMNGYRSGDKKQKAKMVKIVMCWESEQMTTGIAKGILDGSIPVFFDEEKGEVLFSIELHKPRAMRIPAVMDSEIEAIVNEG